MCYDVIILGGGPAGLSAAIYARRACRKTLVLEEKPLCGGQVLDSHEVDNYPGRSRRSRRAGNATRGGA